MGAVPGPELLRPRNGGDVHVEPGIQFPSSTGCNHPFGVHDPYGIHNTWLSLFLLGFSSSETATLKTFHVARRVGPVIPRLSRERIAGWISLLQLGLRWAQAVPNVASSLWRPLSILTIPSWGSILISSSLRASFSLFIAPAFLLLRGRVFPLR